MALYILRPRPKSLEGYAIYVEMGYLGSYDRYLATESFGEQGPIFVNGDLGHHCTGCAMPANILCDYPVGYGKTCDRSLCDDHSFHVASDTDYCRDHYILWSEYLASQRGYDVLANVTPTGDPRKKGLR